MRVEKAQFQQYETIALHGSINAIHRITIGGEVYSFVAPLRRRWVYKNDTISFDWELDSDTGQRRIDCDTVAVLNKDGIPIKHGCRFADVALLDSLGKGE